MRFIGSGPVSGPEPVPQQPERSVHQRGHIRPTRYPLCTVAPHSFPPLLFHQCTVSRQPGQRPKPITYLNITAAIANVPIESANGLTPLPSAALSISLTLSACWLGHPETHLHRPNWAWDPAPDRVTEPADVGLGLHGRKRTVDRAPLFQTTPTWRQSLLGRHRTPRSTAGWAELTSTARRWSSSRR